MENTEKKSQWGGARKGAGRKATGGHDAYFRARPETMAILEAISGNKSDYINAAIQFYHSHNK